MLIERPHYVPSPGSWLSKVKARQYGELLFREAHDRDGLPPREIVDMARDRKSLLHDEFEWDDKIAGEEHRMEQARRLVRAISVTFVHGERQESHEVTVRAMHNTTRNGRRAYRTIDAISSDATQRAQVIQQAYDALLTWQARYDTYSELGDIAKFLKKLNIPELVRKTRQNA